METLMNKTPKTEFEKLIWERHMNKELCKELVKLRKDQLKLEEKIKEKNIQYEDVLRTMREDEKGAIVSRNAQLKAENKVKTKKIKDLKYDYQVLLLKNIELEKKNGCLVVYNSVQQNPS